MAEPTAGQIALLIASVALFAAGWGLSLARLWFDREALRIAAKACMYARFLSFSMPGGLLWSGSAIAIGAYFSASIDQVLATLSTMGGTALAVLGTLLALFVLYTQRTRPLRGLDWFVSPTVVLLLVAAAVFGRAKPHEYDIRSVWLWTHLVTVFGGALAFAVAGAVGAMYLLVNRRLRNKRAGPGGGLGSLERLEHLTLASVTLGFSLLTLGTITGLVQYLESRGKLPAVKLALALSAWVVYAVVLHSPINPSFRGRKAAVLSVVGFFLVVGTIIVVQFVQ